MTDFMIGVVLFVAIPWLLAGLYYLAQWVREWQRRRRDEAAFDDYIDATFGWRYGHDGRKRRK